MPEELKYMISFTDWYISYNSTAYMCLQSVVGDDICRTKNVTVMKLYTKFHPWFIAICTDSSSSTALAPTFRQELFNPDLHLG